MVRQLQYSDISGIIQELRPTLDAAHAEVGFDSPPDYEHMAATWTGLLFNEIGKGYGLYLNGAAKGILLGMIFPDSIAGLKQGQECLWVVDKTARYHALELLDEFAYDCKRAGCKKMVATATTGPTIERMRRLYNRLGYRPTAEAFSIAL